MIRCLFDTASACLAANDPSRKVELTAQTARDFREGKLVLDGDAPAPLPITAPGRPDRPNLVSPRDLASRGLGSREGRAAFLHAIAHIEFNAINLAWDAVYRFRGLPLDYYADWVRVAEDEARHFVLLQTRLRELGHEYGDFDAHDGLWEMCEKTAHSHLERMALVPRVLEARGLDVSPAMIEKLRALGDDASADIIALILREEVAHVAAGTRWYLYACAAQGREPLSTFRELLRGVAKGALRGPFNHEARHEAGFDAEEMAMIEELVSGIRAVAGSGNEKSR